jgi:hypothetical protein
MAANWIERSPPNRSPGRGQSAQFTIVQVEGIPVHFTQLQKPIMTPQSSQQITHHHAPDPEQRRQQTQGVCLHLGQHSQGFFLQLPQQSQVSAGSPQFSQQLQADEVCPHSIQQEQVSKV